MDTGGIDMTLIVMLIGVFAIVGVGFLLMVVLFGSNKKDEDDPDDRIGF